MARLEIRFKKGDRVVASPPGQPEFAGEVIDLCHLTGQVRLSRSGLRGSWVFASDCRLETEPPREN